MPDWTKQIGETIRTAFEAIDTAARMHDHKWPFTALRRRTRARRLSEAFRQAVNNTALALSAAGELCAAAAEKTRRKRANTTGFLCKRLV